MEVLKEENHKLTLKIENLKKSHATELEYVREETEIKEKEFNQQLAKLKEEAKNRELLKSEKIQSLNEELNSLRDEHENVLAQNEKLRIQNDILKNAKSTGACSTYSDYEGLKESERTLKAQLLEKDELLTSHSEKILSLGEEVRECRGFIAELTERLEGKESMFKELSTRFKELEREKEEECGVLQNEVLTLKEEIKALRESGASAAGDGEGSRSGGGGGARGNSLFSEVEERRLKVETELTRLRNHVKRLTEENRNLQLDLERGDTHSAAVTTQLELITKSEEELAADIKKDRSEILGLIDTYRDRLEGLRSEYTRKLLQYKSGNVPSSSSAEQESLREERDSLLLIRITLEREINQLKRELKYNKHLRTNAEAHYKILKAKLEKVQQQQSKEDNNGMGTKRPDSNANVPEILDIDEDKLDENREKINSTPSTPNPLIERNRNSSIKSRKTEADCKQQ